MKSWTLCFLLLFFIPAFAQKQNSKNNWPSFRGLHAAGVAEGQNLPEQWNVEKGTNIKWKMRIPGLAHSSPIVWDDKLFVTTAISSRANATFKPGLYGDGDTCNYQWDNVCARRT